MPAKHIEVKTFKLAHTSGDTVRIEHVEKLMESIVVQLLVLPFIHKLKQKFQKLKFLMKI